MKRVVLILFCIVTIVAAQSAVPSQDFQETLARGYWSDSSTGLMWTAKDNGSDISWATAVKHCHNLRLAGYSDWRLPSIDELERIYDGSGFDGPQANGGKAVFAGGGKGGLLLTGA